MESDPTMFGHPNSGVGKCGIPASGVKVGVKLGVKIFPVLLSHSVGWVDDDSGLEPRILKLELEEPVEMEIPGLEKTQDEHPDWGGQPSWKVVYPFVAIVHTRI
ncbi:hypothetical protein N7453_011577 [Penicillium expansum]|nr:hypothetical protein N7453_011577 [Penicillium expansum]